MKSHSRLSHSHESADPLVASIQARPFSDPQFEQPDTQTHDLSQVDLFSHAPQRGPIQTKLTIGQPNDMYEQEADRVASQVVNMPASATQQSVQREAAPEDELQMKPLATTVTPLIQRESEGPEAEDEELQMKPVAGSIQRESEGPEAEDEELQMKPVAGSIQRESEAPEAEEEELQMKPLNGSIQRESEAPEAEEEGLQMQSSPAASSQPSTASLENQLSSSQGGGSPLPDDVRSFMEPRFGADFSQVRVHTGGESVQMNQDLSAQAFTHKQDIYFGAGKGPANDDLTAHELTHVIQQNGAIAQRDREA